LRVVLLSVSACLLLPFFSVLHQGASGCFFACCSLGVLLVLAVALCIPFLKYSLYFCF
jgi:hypothetical protein